MSKTTIAWADDTWNPLAGCSMTSPGCLNCYAMKMAKRLEAMGKEKYKGTTKTVHGKTVWTGKINLDEKALLIPLKTKKPTMYFVNSMSDLFHENVPDDFIDKVFAVMALCPQHIFQVLTKRANRMAEYLGKKNSAWEETGQFEFFNGRNTVFGIRGTTSGEWPLPNVWLGVSVEDQQRADERIPHLLRTPAAVRWLSCEPLLGEVDLNRDYRKGTGGATHMGNLRRGSGISWVVAGGESGAGARPCNVAWIRSLVQQCRDADVACFVKQLGSNPTWTYWTGKPLVPIDQPYCSSSRDIAPGIQTKTRLKDSKGGDMSEWPEDLQIRQFPGKDGE